MSEHNNSMIEESIEVMIVLSIVWALGMATMNVLQWIGIL